MAAPAWSFVSVPRQVTSLPEMDGSRRPLADLTSPRLAPLAEDPSSTGAHLRRHCRAGASPSRSRPPRLPAAPASTPAPVGYHLRPAASPSSPRRFSTSRLPARPAAGPHRQGPSGLPEPSSTTIHRDRRRCYPV
ncbi:desiccation/radiation resistance protein DR_1769-like [Triticum dicoccoides]|uniref:desiccation/radiation resistance protein DR_1769-like n=1 Tax=Triticum dicoccoides TaxID=85692 RepID=UPI00188FBBCD|nr:desiccation/radiation resistance protein DR_1769-like [Triticum dicoccoides]